MKKRIIYAGVFTRFLAAMIDQFIIGLILMTALGFIGVSLGELILPLVFATMWLYYSYQESSKYMATLGKRAMRITVTNMDGKRISFLRATGRFVAKIITGSVFVIGYIAIIFTEKHQGLYDMIAGTCVVKVGKPLFKD